MPSREAPPAREIDDLIRAETLDVLRECHADGPYPCPEAEVKSRVATRVKGQAPAKGLKPRIGRVLGDIATLDRPRLGAPRHAVFPGDEDRLYALAPREMLAAVEIMRMERTYPVGLPALGARLRLTGRGRKALAERLLSGDVPDGLSVVLCGRARTPKLTLRGEEDFDRPLRKAEQLDLRIRFADRARGVATVARAKARVSFEEEFTAIYDEMAREERSPYVPVPRLREAMPAWDRAAFDAGVIALCEQDRFQLSEHEHPSRLTEAERTASLHWGPDGRAYHFLSRV